MAKSLIDLKSVMVNEKIRVLFVCVHNSARSQMTEAYLNLLGQERFFAESAGLQPGKLNPLVIQAWAKMELIQ